MKKVVYESPKFAQKKAYIKVRNVFADKKYESTIRYATKYLEIYPNDENVIFMRAKSYRELEMYQNSIDDLKYILENLDSTNCFAYTELYFLYYYLNMYEEAYKMLPTMYEKHYIKSHSLAISELVMRKYFGTEQDFKCRSRFDYTKGQILNYSDEAALEHIKSHVKSLSSLEKQVYFKEDINLQYLIETVRENVKESKKVNMDEMLEVHYFGINGIGYNELNYIYDYIKVVVVPNTNNIITIYPTDDIDPKYTKPLICDNEKLFNKDKVKIKNMSQIEKFNKRYKRV